MPLQVARSVGDHLDARIDVEAECVEVMTEHRRPVGVCPPRGCVQHRAAPTEEPIAGEVLQVFGEQGPTRLGRRQRVRGERREVDAALEQQPGLESGIGDDGGALRGPWGAGDGVHVGYRNAQDEWMLVDSLRVV